MRVARFFGERDIGELVDRLFSLEGKADALKRAGRAVVEANKHLPLGSGENLADVVKPRTMLAVPSVPGAEPRGQAAPRIVQAAGETGVDRMRAALPTFAARLAAANDRSVAIVRDSQSRLDHPVLRDAMANDERLAEMVQSLEELAVRRLDGLRALQEIQDDVLNHVEETVTRLMEIAARPRA